MAFIGSVWLVRAPLQQRIRERATLANEAPTEEGVSEMIEESSDPRAALLAAWHSGKIIHREVAIRTLGKIAPARQPLPPELDALLVSAALDPDLSVRESALGLLGERKHPALGALAAAQLHDPDLQVRTLGLNYLKGVPPEIGVPTVIPLLDDTDPLIVSMTLKLLEHWSGENFGVKLSETAAFQNEKTGRREYRDGSSEKSKAGATRAKAWWGQNQQKFPAVKIQVPAEAYSARQKIPAGDFQLRTVEGKLIRLSDFRGKVVLLNFWTTWCTACVSEIPELIDLQKRHRDDLAILGVSLDYVPDSHGHIGGHAAVEEQSNHDSHHEDHERTTAALERVREKVRRTAKARGINYPILLDEQNQVGGRFNGGELPTTILVDPQGFVRRRFIGARSLSEFEAMVAEALRPGPATGR